MSTAALEIRKQLVDYLAGDIDYDRLDEWMAQNTWDVHKSADEEASALVYAVEARLAEFSGGFVSENRLREHLKPFVTQYKTVVVSADAKPEIDRGSSTRWTVAEYQIGRVEQFAGTSVAEVPA